MITNQLLYQLSYVGAQSRGILSEKGLAGQQGRGVLGNFGFRIWELRFESGSGRAVAAPGGGRPNRPITIGRYELGRRVAFEDRLPTTAAFPLDFLTPSPLHCVDGRAG